jgi:hypothetical protein
MQSSSTTGTVIQLAAGAIGSAWGYPGMMIGLSIGAFIASKVAGGHNSHNQGDLKNLNFMTRLDNVPYVIGTAMCPGQIIWFGQMSLLDSATLRSGAWDYTSGAAYFSSYYRPLDSKFAVAFCGRNVFADYPVGVNDPRINRVLFDSKDKWNWCLWLADVVKWKESLNLGDFSTPLFNIDLKCNTHQTTKDYLLNGIPHKHFCWMSYDGWFGDYSSFELMSPNELSKALKGKDPYNDGLKFDFTKATTLERFPNITAEISSGSLYTHEGFGEPTVTPSANRHSCRDGMHDYYYAWSSAYYYDPYRVYYKLKRIHPVYGSVDIFSYPGTDYVLSEANFSRTDEWLDRIYFFGHRRFENRYTPYAKYSFAYDLFYIDRKTLLPHSLKLDEKIYISDTEGPASTIQIQSMEITENELLFFGWMVQDSFPLNYGAKIVSIGNNSTRIYCDLSGVPDGTFNGWFCWTTSANATEEIGDYYSASFNGCPREILNQTTTYIDIEKDFGLSDNKLVGEELYINYAKTWEQEYVVADLGSTSTMIICNCPASNMRSDNGDQFYSVKLFLQNSNIENRIDWTRTVIGGAIYLLDPLSVTPAPGSKIYLIHYQNTALDRDVIYRVLPGRMQNRYAECKQMPWSWGNIDWISYEGIPTVDGGWRPPHVQTNGSNLFVVLRFDKNTGEFLGILNGASVYVRHIHGWGDAVQYTTDPASTIITCATDKQIFVHACCMQNATNGAACDFIIDSETLSVGDRLWASNPFGSGGAAGTFPVATAWLNTYNAITHALEKSWYALWFSYAGRWETHTSLVDGVYVDTQVQVDDSSIFFSRLTNGSFSNPQKIFVRKLLYSAPILALWWLGGSPKETRFIAKMGLEDKLFICFNHSWDAGNFSFIGYNETWVFEAPTENSPQGNSRCIDQTYNDWLCHKYGSWDGDLIAFNEFTSSLSTVIVGTKASSYHCDCNPITSIHDLLYYSGSTFGGWFNLIYTTPTYNSYGKEIASLLYNDDYYFLSGVPPIYVQAYYPYTYTDAMDYCQQAVVAQVIINDQLVSYLEPRYQYSECLSNVKSFYQIAKDIMQSCMGWITLCQGEIRFIVPRQGERAEYYFGTEEDGHLFVGTQDSPAWGYSVYGDAMGIIYIDVSSYPLNYFKGETGSFTYDGALYEFAIIENLWEDKIRIGIYNRDFYASWQSESIPFTGIEFTIYRKDNIKEGSFVYGQKSKMGMPNITRLEFEDRTKNYITELSEVVSESLRQSDGYDKIQTYSMPGIKRATQAARVVQQLQDYLEFVEWTCGFETDIMGMHLCPGVIIGISHAVTGWVNKLFRVMSLEETGDDFNMKLELEEYVPSVYHDHGIPPIISGTGSGTPTSGWNSAPLPLNNFSILEDQTMPYLWIGYNSAGAQSNLVGVNVLRLNGADWELVGTVLGVPTTMELSVPLIDSRFDNQSISYVNTQGGTIPLSGYVWIGSELIEYNGVDANNGKLMNLVRGVNDTLITSHSNGNLITVFGTTSYITFLESWVGVQEFRITPLVYGVVSTGNESDSPLYSMVIVGYAFKPHPPESLRLVEE